MKKVVSVLTLFFLLTMSAYPIQEDKKISLDEAIELALSTNPQIELAKLEIDIAKNKVKSASRLQNPSLTTFQNIPKAGLGNPQQIGLDYTYEILKRGKRKETAQTYIFMASDNEKFLEQILISEIKKAYINLLVKKTQLEILKQQEALTKTLYETTKKEAITGSMDESDVIQAKIALNRSIMYTNTARSNVITAQNSFNSILNSKNINYDTKEEKLTEEYEKFHTLPPNKKIPDFASVRALAISNRYDLKVAKKEVDAAIKNLEVVKSQKIPDIELSGGYSYQTKGMSESNHFESGGYIGASLVNIPVLYNFKPEIQNAELEIQKAELKYKDTETDAIRNLGDAYEKYVIARENLNLYNDKLLQDSKELINLSSENLKEKKIDLTDYLVSKKLYLELILGYEEILGEYYTSYAELLREMNTNSVFSAENL